MLLSQSEAIVRANLDGSGATAVVTFPMVNTASEYVYYPEVAWHNGVGLASVSSPDPFFEEATADLWQIPVTGEAIRLGTIPGLILNEPPHWSPDGSRLAYVKQILDESNPPPALTLTDGEGQNPFPYSTRRGLRFDGWSDDNRQFLFAAENFFAVGRVGDPAQPITLAAGTAVSAAQWVGNETFVFASGASPTWTLYSGNSAGTTSPLLEIRWEGAPLLAVTGQ